jgi:hypothetical protein
MRFLLAISLFFLPVSTWGAPKHCSETECRAVKPECKGGAEVVNVATADECCPRYACRAHPKPKNCGGAVCSGIAPVCTGNQERVNKALDGACCPDWSCQDKVP